MANSFLTQVDIGNRALQHCGATRIVAFTDDSKNASEIAFTYPKVRQAELRRNVWRFAIRKAVLRPIDTTTLSFIPAVYDATKTYIPGTIIASDATQNFIFFAKTFVPISAPPGDNNVYWEQYFGPLTVIPWETGTKYYSGDLVYTPQTSAYKIYVSLPSGNDDVPTTVPAYDATVIYAKGQTVTYSAIVYQSAHDLNVGNTPAINTHWIAVPATQPVQMMGQKWLQLNATGATMQVNYPVGSGPRSQPNNRNVFRLPNGFLRKAPQDPKAGSVSFLGAPGGGWYDDWDLEGNFLVSTETQPIVLRFVANIVDVEAMDPMFCEGLAARLALEVVETLTQSTSKLSNIAAVYKQFMAEARTVNGIETGPTEPPEDDWITTRA